MGNKKVFVTGFFDLLNSGHVDFFREAARLGDLYVGVGSDATFAQLKGRQPVGSEKERLYMVRSVRHVKDAMVNRGTGLLDFVGTLDAVRPDIFVVNSSEGNDLKRRLCRERGIEYVELDQSAADAPGKCRLPYRIDIAGTWIDQPYVSHYGAGWAITASIEPTHEFMERGGMSTSTRNAAKKIWPYELPAYNGELLARLLFCFENDPENKGHVSGAQDAIGICMSGLNRHYYDNSYWPGRIESCHDEAVLSWLERHLCLVPMFPRRPGCSVVAGKDITPEKVARLTGAAARCWDAIMAMDLEAFAEAFRDSFDAQVAMFPAMMQPGVADEIEKVRPYALAWKMTGAGGGGHLLLVVSDRPEESDQVIPVKIRRF